MQENRIWKRASTLPELNSFSTGTLIGTLGIEFTAMGDDYLEATLPVDSRTIQPLGYLHGGASVVLAESLGSIASLLCCEVESVTCFGLEVNANHIRSVRSGLVTGRVTPIHLGKSTHVWDIKIRDEANLLICVSRLTVAIVPQKGKAPST